MEELVLNFLFKYFLRLILQNFEEVRKIMLDRGNIFLERLNQTRGKIVKSASKFIVDGSVLFHFLIIFYYNILFREC